MVLKAHVLRTCHNTTVDFSGVPRECFHVDRTPVRGIAWPFAIVFDLTDLVFSQSGLVMANGLEDDVSSRKVQCLFIVV